MPSTPTRSIAKRACDACRRRKVKCDAALPVCAYCGICGLECTYNLVAKKRGPKPTRDIAHTSASPSSPVPHESSGQNQYVLASDAATPHTSSSVAAASVGEIPTTSFAESTRGYPGNFGDKAIELREQLLRDIPCYPNESLHEHFQHLIGLMMQYAYGGFPTFHERSLRHNAAWILEESYAEPPAQETTPWVTVMRSGEKSLQIVASRAFALLTAVCGMASTLYTNNPDRGAATTFYHISREMLRLYKDYDTENPDSSSLIIRNCHAMIHQHTTGQTHTSTYINGQARLLAQNMRLHDELVLESCEPVEAQLLRHCFWQLLTSDRAAASLLSRSFSMHESLFDCPITVYPIGSVPIALLDLENSNHKPPYEERLLITYWLGHKMRSYAADLTFGLRSHRRRFTDSHPLQEDDRQRLIREDDRQRLAEMYIKFICMLDETPDWIISPGEASVAEESVSNYQRESFLLQRANWFLTFHCLSITVLHQCIEHGLVSVLGLNDSPLSLSLRQTDIARDFVIALEETPFRILRFSGESVVQQIRHVGSILLRINESATDETITHRAGAYLTRLINVLSRLDSLASEVMDSRHEQTKAQENQPA